MEFNFIPAILQKPENNKPILIRYRKGQCKRYDEGGMLGVFITQGFYYNDNIWYDYNHELLRAENAKKSKNEILEWAYIN